MQEVLINLSGRKLPISVSNEILETLKNGGELQILITVFPDGINVKLSDDDAPHEIVYKVKAINIRNINE